MRIAVDVMGGDHGCGVVIEGVKSALNSNDRIRGVYLVGNRQDVEAAVKKVGLDGERVQIVHASEVLTMNDKPVVGLRRKKDCSILKAVDLVKDGHAQAIISPGNTGGVVAASTIRLRQLPEVDRPVIATVIPTPKGGFVLLDSGANVECRPFHLLQFAVMGSVYSREVLGCAKPRVGLLSIGTEESKGNELTLEAFKFCNSCRPDILNFVGNVEGHDLFAGRVDVVVCDGFIGNIVLKTCESMAAELFNWFKSELQKNPVRRFGALLAKNAFLNIKNRVDPDTYGGAPLLGLNGLVMITHGSAKKKAIKNAVLFAAEAVQHHINEVITDEIQQTYAKLEKDRLISPSTTTS